MMKFLFSCSLLFCSLLAFADHEKDSTRISSLHAYIQYTGRTDVKNPDGVVMWAPGTYIDIFFEGTYCVMNMNDEMRWGTSHNYLVIQVDKETPYRIRLNDKKNRIVLANNLQEGNHRIRICKSTEAEIGYVQAISFIVQKLNKPEVKPNRRIEFIGDSITCGMGNDESGHKCGEGQWYDQNNAYIAYGPLTARALNSQWMLSSISGIGLIHSCCNKQTVMPPLYKKMGLSTDTINWDFSRNQADVVTICLGQNDGIQDSTAFCGAYVKFMEELRGYYPNATLVMLTSPMAGKELNNTLQKYILSIENHLKKGDKKVDHYFFSKQFTKGCTSHPSADDHVQMANELIEFLKRKMKW